jgi:tetratricopeptide (TPR) repeat protein
MMKRFREALNDADYGIRLNPRWAKLHSRKAVAHFYLKEYDDSVQAYLKALEFDGGKNVEYQKGLDQARKLGGSLENLQRKKKEEESERREREREANQCKVSAATQQSAQKEKVKAERDRAMLERYERECLEYRQARRECLDKWRRSTGLSEKKPEEDRGRSVRVDIFGTLRGRCLNQSCDCTAWHRDVDAVHNAWGNMEAIQCSRCGYSNADHEDCGQYPMTEPLKPQGLRVEEVKIPGIHKAF